MPSLDCIFGERYFSLSSGKVILTSPVAHYRKKYEYIRLVADFRAVQTSVALRGMTVSEENSGLVNDI